MRLNASLPPACVRRVVKQETRLARTRNGFFFRSAFAKSAVHQVIASINHASAAKLRQLDFFFFSRFESHRRSCRDIEPHSVRRATIKCELAIYLEKMIVTTDLDRSVAGVAHDAAPDTTRGVRLDRPGFFV